MQEEQEEQEEPERRRSRSRRRRTKLSDEETKLLRVRVRVLALLENPRSRSRNESIQEKNLDETEYLIQFVYINLVENEYWIDGSRLETRQGTSSSSFHGSRIERGRGCPLMGGWSLDPWIEYLGK